MIDDDTDQFTLTGKAQASLVNRQRVDDWDVYIGRADQGRSHIRNTDPTDDGWLGNPYRVGDAETRSEVIQEYREAFRQRLRNDAFREAVDDLHGNVLACWCKPKDCHGDIILDYLRGHLEPAVDEDRVAHYICPHCGFHGDVVEENVYTGGPERKEYECGSEFCDNEWSA